MLERRIQNMTIKVSFNVTNITYDLFNIDGEEIKSNRYYETLLHKRTEKYINNYLLKKVKETNSVGYDIKEIDTEKIISEIPYELALDYKV